MAEEVVSDEEGELQEESVSDNETSLPAVKNGDVLKKLDSGDFVLAWQDKTYVVDQSDNTVWTHESATDYGLVDSVGVWNPETKVIEWDEDEE